MDILVINAGSSSLKYQVFDMDKQTVLGKGLCERIGIDGHLKHESEGKDKYEADIAMPTHAEAIKAVINILTDKEQGCLADMSSIGAVGHRVVHGGEDFSASVLVDDKVIKVLEDISDLAPLHNPPNIMGIKSCAEVMGNVPQVAVFDTAFHQSMPRKAFLYALPYEFYEKYKVRRYGFHGTSHKYVSGRAAAMLGKPADQCKIVTCHLGNGSSIAAVCNGKSVDTSMGMTPLEGLPMGTRCGNIDPAILEFIMPRENLDIKAMTNIMNKKSGMLGMSCVSADFRDLYAAKDKGDQKAEDALSVFAYSVKKFIGAYSAAMGGVDAVVFTAGIGENIPALRADIMEGLDFMGLSLDDAKNQERGGERAISTADSRAKIFVIPTNEELVIAADTAEIVGK